MTIRTQESTKVQMRLIMAMARYLMEKGYKVSADHIGYPNGQPQEFNHFIPDIYAVKGKEKIIIEAETCDSLNDSKTRTQWTALSTNEEKVDFAVIVPTACYQEAKDLAKKWNIKVKNFWKLVVS